MANINEEVYFDILPPLKEDTRRINFEQVDVSSWEDNACLFRGSFDWSSAVTNDENGRINFFAANARIVD